ncbi:MAG TPA: hypothetical protein PKD64_14715 [Pirellulaceae bacterium]|nr:hypothetical protein [Pirellulaceae bacterium]HMO93434.1 hypothetical protein [Pirellulaceae bacterium]HMP68458.1 hypothetical protein [Pirellulaceae bacterium]
MIEAFVLLLFLVGLNHALFQTLRAKRGYVDANLLHLLFAYHALFAFVYYSYVQVNRSDSHQFYRVAMNIGNDWWNLFETGTPFISFVAAPFAQAGLPYAAVMLLFAWFGFWGFVYAYLWFRESVECEPRIFGNVNFLYVLLFLPNMHFWTSSLGKGSLIFLGMMMFTYSSVHFQRHWWKMLLGGFIVFMIRPHVLVFLAGGLAFGYLLAKGNVSQLAKLAIIGAGMVGLWLSANNILAITGLDDSESVEEFIEDFQELTTQQSGRLSTSGSGIDMSNYSVPFKMFTFWFRPLFIDSPNFLGHFSSMENLLYLLIFLHLMDARLFTFLRQSSPLVLMSLVAFLGVSFILSLMMSNMGIMLRQKSMVMYFGFYVVYAFLAWKQVAHQQRAQYDQAGMTQY